MAIIGLSIVEAVQINKPVMLGLALRHVFADEINRPTHNFKTIEDRHLGVLRALLISMKFDGKVSGDNMNNRVQIQNEVRENTARKHTFEASSLGLIRDEPAINDNREIVYNFAHGGLAKLTEYSVLELAITEVVKIQIANPTDHTAGKELVGKNIYFNVIASEMRCMANEAIKKKRDEKNKKKGKDQC